MNETRPSPINVIKVVRPPDFGGVELCCGSRVTHSYPRHWHDELHFSLVTAGAGFVHAGGAAHLTPPATLTVVAPGEVHANSSDYPEGCDFRSMYIDVGLAKRSLAAITAREAKLPDFNQYVFSELEVTRSFLRLHCALEKPESLLCRESLLVQFLGKLVARHSDGVSIPPSAGKETRAVRRVREFVDAHYAEPLSLHHLSQVAGLTPFHLNRVFCRETGLPPHAYQVHLRVMRAKALLRKRVPIAQVATATGFVDQSHFSRHFRRIVGVTPGRFAPAQQERTRPVARFSD
jgi:AraC-like DNA-binding protein